jgi:hypothetical protein
LPGGRAVVDRDRALQGFDVLGLEVGGGFLDVVDVERDVMPVWSWPRRPGIMSAEAGGADRAVARVVSAASRIPDWSLGHDEVVERDFQQVGDLAQRLNVAALAPGLDLRKKTLRDSGST